MPSPSYTTLENPYAFESKPYIRVFGNGDGTFAIETQNGRQQWSFKNIDEYLEIDSEQMNFYKDTVYDYRLDGSCTHIYMSDFCRSWFGTINKEKESFQSGS